MDFTSQKVARTEKTYCQWVQEADRSHLSKFDLNFLKRAKQWDRANPALAKTMDLLIGQTLSLARNMNAFEGRSYAKGMRVLIIGRWGCHLHGKIEGCGITMSFRPDWLTKTS